MGFAFLATGIIIAAAAAFFEIRLVSSSKTLFQKVASKPNAGMGLSLVISLMLGAAFGAAGVTLMVAFIFSTIFTQAIYGMKKRSMNREKKEIINRERLNEVLSPWITFCKIVTWPFKVLWFIITIPSRVKKAFA